MSGAGRGRVYAPDAVVEVAGDPLADEIGGLVRLDKGLVGVDVWDVVEGLSVGWGDNQQTQDRTRARGGREGAHRRAWCGML